LHGVERGVTSRFFPGFQAWRVAPWVAVLCAMLAAATPVRSAVREVAAPTFAPVTPEPASAPAKPKLDELVYVDGDRVRGHFIEKQGDVLVFRSERFGLLRVPSSEADVLIAKEPETSTAVAEAVAGEDKADVIVEHGPFSPLAMARELKEFFGSWHGRFTIGAEVLQDVSDHTSVTADARLQRRWKSDEVQLNLRYDLASVNEVVATDMLKGDALWRHELPGRFFTVYRPTIEWNRAFYRDDLPSDYVLLQQEVGAGINVFIQETRKLRVGASENIFDTWVTPIDAHFSQTVESLFTELEFKLPWRITVTNRGVWYYSIADKTDGWENRFEISKKLTETLTIGARHETRHNNPDVRSADYERLKMLFGFDF
ncbi:MAG TPA: hypothetical protein VEQ65_04615, partial [Opitutus sp.]|nr:hypothetical protein [Opitutus sp.]